MSDFDKEAEREKLRKKFAADEEKRADTRRMSDLLLKGATMTNKHCDRCGDPLFRYDGRTFCPTCQADESRSVEPEADTDSGEASETQPPSESSAASEAGADSGVAAERSTSAERSTPSPATSSLDEAGAETGPGVRSADRTGGSADELIAARQSLARTLNRFARQAEGTEDPRRARELLAAAREAAATLAELD